MRTNGPILIKMATALFVCVMMLTLLADKLATPPKRDALIGSWIGFDEDRLTFGRLQLSKDGTGVFSTTFTTNAAKLYEVKNWDLKDFEVEVKLVAIDSGAEPIYLKGKVWYHDLELEMGGLELKWKRKITLFNEDYFLTRNASARKRIETHAADNSKGKK